VGFGIRVPGVRISTRGVRVGPRIASVRVSTRGRVSGSVGPRVARVNVSGRGVRMSSGAGPVSVGRGGVRVSAGLGPVFGSVGGGSGVRVGVGVGPVWASTGSGGRRVRTSQTSNQRTTSERSRPRMGQEYKAYRASLDGQGSGRRNRDEMRIAGINAGISQMLVLLTFFQDYFHPKPNLPDNEQVRRQTLEFVRNDLARQGRYSWPLPTIPKKLSAEELRTTALSLLADEGIEPPIHPSQVVGLPFDYLPSSKEVEDVLIARARASASPFRKFFKGKQIEVSAKSEAASLLTSIQENLANWERESREIELLVAKRMADVEIENNHRIEQVTKQLSDEAELLSTEVSGLESKQKIVLETIQQIHRRFLEGDTTLSTIILQAAYSDNQGTAAPVGFDGEDILIVMCVPAADDVIWPESMVIKYPISAKKKTKAEMADDYREFLLCHTVATAKEAAVVLPHVRRVRVVVLGENDASTELLDRRVLATMTATREQLDLVPSTSSTPGSHQARQFVGRWTNALQQQNLGSLYNLIDEVEGSGFPAFRQLINEVMPIVRALDPTFNAFHDVPKKSQLRLRDVVEGDSSSDGEVEISENIDAEDLERSDFDIADINEAWFWLFAGLLADVWDEDEVDTDSLEKQALDAVSLVFPESLHRGVLNKPGEVITSHFRVGDTVEHPTFGRGLVIEATGEADKEEALVDFVNSGRKRLLIAWSNIKLVPREESR
jgi:hypothetical protein